jgi:hypothetical protein
MNSILHIVTPCTRKQEYLDRCYQSIIQLDCNWKWYIIINKNVYKHDLDISKYNNTKLLIQERENKWNSLINHYLDNVNEPNSFVFFLDDDNLIHPNFNKAYDELITNSAEVNSLVLTQEGKFDDGRYFTREALSENIMVEKIDQGQVVFKRSIIGDLRYWENIYRGDGYFIMEYFIRDGKNKGKVILFQYIGCYYNAQKWMKV